MKTGKVWLVGAGPGAVGLLTVRGKSVLEMADAIVYDALVGEEIVAGFPAAAKKVYVGKRAGRHSLRQEEINQILVELALEGNRVVRLKGGDSFLFGRGGEELEALCRSKIPFEVVPGVASALAVPAYAGIPVTHRQYASSLHIVTGHRQAGEKQQTDYRALCEAGGTYVFLMGVASLREICAGFLAAGMRSDMPAALIERGTTAEQKCVVADIATLPQEAEKSGILAPAVLVIGQVCSFSGRFSWLGEKALSGWRVIVTRTAERGRELSDRLRFCGAQVLELPAIRINPYRESAAVQSVLKRLERYQWIVFTSPSGVEQFFARCRERGIDNRRFAEVRFAVIGAGTGKRLAEYGFYADVTPEIYSGKMLGKALAQRLRRGDTVLLARARGGNRELADELKRVPGVTLEDIAFYETVSEICTEQYRLLDVAGKAQQENTVVVFTSRSTVRGFVDMFPEVEWADIKAACIGEQTQAAADACGMRTYTADEASVDSLVSLVCGIAAEKTEGKQGGE